MTDKNAFGKRNRPQPRSSHRIDARTVSAATCDAEWETSEKSNTGLPGFGATTITVCLVIAGAFIGTGITRTLLSQNVAESAISVHQTNLQQETHTGRQQTVKKELTKAAAELREKIPLAVDDHTTLIDAKSSGTTLIYTYRIGMPKSIIEKSMPGDGFANALQKDTRRKVCAHKDMRRSMMWGAAYTYIYVDTNHDFMGQFTLTNQDCA